ncbi:MAG TPA: alpha/beta hydrolase [Gemmatimonadales bacterium]|nr:alpha/beta hydrolase [Gemmatimonadales bacterium]
MRTTIRFPALALAAVGLSAAAALDTIGGGAPVRFGHAELASGVRLRYAEAGNPAAPPVIMLHGYSDSWYSFSPILPLLESRYRLIAVDQRGHGASDQPESGYGLRTLAEDVVALMNELKIRQATVVGHSMGSLVAQQMGLIAPERIERLVLVGSGTALGRMNGRDGFVEAVNALTDPVSLEFIREFQVSTIHHPVPPAFLDSVIGESTRLSARVWKSLLAGMIGTAEAEGLATKRIPTLLVWGEHDSVFSKENRDELAQQLPDAERIDYEDTGHAVHWERPERFAEDLDEFIRRTPARGGAR